MENIYYVYEYVDPITNLPFYIGKGKGIRIFRHLKETINNTDNKRKHRYIKRLLLQGLTPIIRKIEENLFESEAYDLEESLISKYGRKGLDPGGILMNICSNNRPPVISGKRHHNYGRPVITMHTEKTKKKISESKKGKESWHKGRPKSDEFKEKLSKSHTGKKLSESTKKKLSLINQGKNNPNYGTKWITNDIVNIKIKKYDEIPLGWRPGRVLGKYKKKDT